MDLREERELAYQRLLAICQSGLLSIKDFRCALCTLVRIRFLVGALCKWELPLRSWKVAVSGGAHCRHCCASIAHRLRVFVLRRMRRHNPLNIFAAHEITGFADPSVATKMTVHFNLFGGARQTPTYYIPIAPARVMLLGRSGR